jgi:toxin YoeB
MNKIWIGNSWKDYLYWQNRDRKTLKRINKLIQDIERNGNMHGIGKPEPLMYDFQGCYSRRIDDKNRLVYVVDEAGLNILSCRYHYD